MEDGKARPFDLRTFRRTVALWAALEIAAAAAFALADPEMPASLTHKASILFALVALAAVVSAPLRWAVERLNGAPPHHGARARVLELKLGFAIGGLIAIPVVGLAVVLAWILTGFTGPLGRAWFALLIAFTAISIAGTLIANTLILVAPRGRSS
jgi:hypothetical protein